MDDPSALRTGASNLFHHPDSFNSSSAYKDVSQVRNLQRPQARKTLALVLASRSAYATVVNDSQPNNRETSPSAKPHLCLPESWRRFFSQASHGRHATWPAFSLRRLSFAGIQVGENEMADGEGGRSWQYTWTFITYTVISTFNPLSAALTMPL